MVDTAHFYVFGRVQGVGYRAWTVRAARKLNLSGWVRNRHNGSVEIYATGDSSQIEMLMHSCRQGPTWSRVDRLEVVSVPDAIVYPVEEGVFKQVSSV